MFNKIRRFFLRAEKEAFYERRRKRIEESNRSRRKGSISLKPLREMELGDDIQVKIISAYQWRVNDAIDVYPAIKKYLVLESKELNSYKNLEEFFNSLSKKGK